MQYLPTPDFDPMAPQGQPEYKDATVYKIWNLTLAQPLSRADSMREPYQVACLSAMTEAIRGELNRPLWNHASRGGDLFAGEATSETR